MSTENMRFAPSTTYPRLTAAILLAGVAAGLAALAGCGSGDDHQNTTPPPPATPAFTSSAAATAAEGVAYTYTPAATVSDGSTIAFSMVSGPTGATLTSGVLSWTPTHAQARNANSFDIRATTSAGGTSDQAFSLSPSGSVNGTAIDTWVSATGDQSVPEDLTQTYIGAAYQTGSAWTNVVGVGNADGTFSIAAIPAGNYWLVLNSGAYWTQASNLDLGQNFLGRPDGVLPSSSTTLTMNLTNLDAWDADDTLEIVNPNIQQDIDFGGNLNRDDEVAQVSWPWTGPLSDASKGDAWYAVQSSVHASGATTWNYLFKATAPGAMTQTSGSTTAFTAAFAPVDEVPAHLNLLGSQFNALASAVGAGAQAHTTSIALDIQPFSAAHGAVGEGEPLLEIQGQVPIVADTDFGTMSYGNPFPDTWTPYFNLDYEFGVNFTATGATNPAQAIGELYTATTTLPIAGAGIAPPLTPPLNLALGGAAFTQAATVNSLTPTLSWQAPSTGTPTNYRLSIYQLTQSAGSTVLTPVIDLYSKTSAVTVPPGVLSASGQYCFAVRAYQVPGVDLTVSPYRGAFPWAHADALSPVLTTSSTATVAFRTGASLSAEPIPAVFAHRMINRAGAGPAHR